MVDRVIRWAATPGGRHCLTNAVCSVVLVGLVWSAYGPSFKHAPRADQWCFLLDTLDEPTFSGTLFKSYSYNRTRGFAPGDTDLFRPVLFALLAAEKTAFGPDIGGPQVFGVILHLAFCFLLLTLFRQITAICEREPDATDELPPRPLITTLLPYAVVGFFALNPGVQELVIWSHLHGYLLFLVFLLGSLALLVRHASSPTAGSWRSPALWGAWALAAAAAFTYELGQFYAVLAGSFLAAAVVTKVGRGRAAGLAIVFASILPIYQGVNALDAAAHEGSFVPEHNKRRMLDRAFTRVTATHSARFAVYTAAQPFFPSLTATSFSGGRLQIAESLWTRHGRRNIGPAAWVSAGVLLLAVGLGMAGLARLVRRRDRLPLLVFLLATALYSLYAAMTVLGRMNLRPGPAILSSNCYYTYTALLFALLAGFVGWAGLGWCRPWTANARVGLVVGLAALALLGAEHIRRVNLEVAKGLTPISRPIRAFHAFVRQHRDEPDFSFEIDHAASDPVTPMLGMPVTDVVFAEWMPVREKAKYRVAFRDGTVVVLPPGAKSHPPDTGKRR